MKRGSFEPLACGLVSALVAYVMKPFQACEAIPSLQELFGAQAEEALPCFLMIFALSALAGALCSQRLQTLLALLAGAYLYAA